MENTEVSISEQLAEIWGALTHNQRRFVVAMQESTTKRDAAESIGMTADAVYRWNGLVDKAIDLMSRDVRVSMFAVLESYGIKAAMLKAAALDSKNENVRQSASTEIMDRLLGKPTQRQETEHSGEVEVIQFVEIVSPNNDDESS